MKRTLRQSKGDRLKNEEAKLNGSQKQQFDALKNMAKQYEGKSDSEIFSELSKTVEKRQARRQYNGRKNKQHSADHCTYAFGRTKAKT